MRNNHYICLLMAYFGFAFMLYVIIDNPTQNLFSSFFVAVVGAFTVCAGLATAQKYGLDNFHGKSFLLLSAGSACWLLADTMYYFLQNINNETPFPSIADYVYLLGYPLLFWGFYRELIVEKIKFSFNKLLVPTLFSTLLILGIFYYLVYQAYDPGNSLLANILGVTYGFGDLFLAIIALFVLMKSEEYNRGKFYFPWQFICLGIFVYLVADVLYYAKIDEFMKGGYYGIDLIYALGYLLVAYGFWSIGDIINEVKGHIFGKLKNQ